MSFHPPTFTELHPSIYERTVLTADRSVLMISILSIYTPFAVLFTIKYEKQILFCTQTFIFWSSVMNCDALRYIFFTVMKLKYREQSYFRGSPKVLNLSWSSSSTSSEQLPWLVKLSIRSNRMSETPSPAISLHSESLCSGATVVAGQVGRVWSVMEDWEVAGDAHGAMVEVPWWRLCSRRRCRGRQELQGARCYCYCSMLSLALG